MVSFLFGSGLRGRSRRCGGNTAFAGGGEPPGAGCVSYILHRVEGEPDNVLIYEQYHDEKALAAHRETEHFRKHAVGGLTRR